MQLEGRTTIITGAARGIGAHLAAGLASRGAQVVVADVRDPSETVGKITDAGGAAIGVTVDITSNDQLSDMVVTTLNEFGTIDALVNNAGIFADLDPKPLMQISEDEFDRIMTVNVRGMFQACKAVIPTMQEGGGSIINISSGTIFYGPPGLLPYVTSKAAVMGMTRSMARELGGMGIRVNAIAPGFTESDSVLATGKFERVREPSRSERSIARAMLPEDLLGTVAFLVSDDSGFVTGQLLNVDGGKITY